jgi:hypothetical protein
VQALGAKIASSPTMLCAAVVGLSPVRAVAGRHRPEALRNHNDFKQLYQPVAGTSEASADEAPVLRADAGRQDQRTLASRGLSPTMRPRSASEVRTAFQGQLRPPLKYSVDGVVQHAGAVLAYGPSFLPVVRWAALFDPVLLVDREQLQSLVRRRPGFERERDECCPRSQQRRLRRIQAKVIES